MKYLKACGIAVTIINVLFSIVIIGALLDIVKVDGECSKENCASMPLLWIVVLISNIIFNVCILGYIFYNERSAIRAWKYFSIVFVCLIIAPTCEDTFVGKIKLMFFIFIAKILISIIIIVFVEKTLPKKDDLPNSIEFYATNRIPTNSTNQRSNFATSAGTRRYRQHQQYESWSENEGIELPDTQFEYDFTIGELFINGGTGSDKNDFGNCDDSDRQNNDNDGCCQVSNDDNSGGGYDYNCSNDYESNNCGCDDSGGYDCGGGDD
ncbi:uncharacterized protein LOC133840026 [Drosophila sulfurigaster albostrigata]|uniref:uncharacterized protein LOC133840026 n=1 Tax=Drosophila sulfurigaster albostrigata TaxID=89887 RepID=UPI002D21CA0A|nr:uncharacterized protein LOC133840026 [Drosophila sulfurigaster albostrigata]